MGYMIRIEGGARHGESVKIPDDKPVLVGRGSQNDLCVSDSKLSRHHCQFIISDGKCIVMDLGSTNGTFVGEEKVDTRELEAGSTVTIGRIKLRIDYIEDTQAEADTDAKTACASCGEDIPEDDLAAGNIASNEGKLLCGKCGSKIKAEASDEAVPFENNVEEKCDERAESARPVARKDFPELGKFGDYALKEHLRDYFTGRQYLAERQGIPVHLILTVLHDPNPEHARKVMNAIYESGAVANPNVLMLFEVGEESNEFFFSYECMNNGATLDRVIAESGTISAQNALKIIDMVAHGLSAAVEKHICHGLLSPGSVYLNENYLAKIGEQGVARLIGPESVPEEFAPRVLPFVAPEILAGTSGLTFEADSYSLGAILYYALSGKVAHEYRSGSAKEFSKEVYDGEKTPIGELCPGLDERVCRFIDRCMAASPTNRYQTGVEMIHEIERIIPLTVG